MSNKRDQLLYCAINTYSKPETRALRTTLTTPRSCLSTWAVSPRLCIKSASSNNPMFILCQIHCQGCPEGKNNQAH